MELIAGYIGKARDFKLIDFREEKEKRKESKAIKKTYKDSSANKTNYSTVCRRCGRALKNEESRNRGYGSYCYKKVQSDLARNNNDIEQMEVK